jgi:hypothetical protein
VPKFDHKDLGDVLSYVYLPGLVTAVYPGDKDTPEANRDTADVSISYNGTSISFKNCPIFYHCEKSGVLRDNGSIENASRGFTVGDEALCRCLVPAQKDSAEKPSVFKKVILVSHLTGPKRCSYKYAFLRISATELKELKAPLGKWEYSESSGNYEYVAFDVDSHKDELCVVYDSINKKFADIVDPTKDGTQKYVFPCSVESLKPFLDAVDLELDRELYRWSHQGSSPDDVELASAYPSHSADFSGEKLGVGPTGEPYSTYFEDDPVVAMFTKFTNIVTSTRPSELSSGKFDRLDEYKKSMEGYISDYAGRSPGFLVDTRDKEVSGTVVSSGEKPQSILDDIKRLSEKKEEYASYSTVLSAKRVELISVASSISSDIAGMSAHINALQDELNDILSKLTGGLDASHSSAAYVSSLMQKIAELSASIDSVSSVYSRKLSELESLDASISEVGQRISDISSQISALNNFNAVIVPAISPKGDRLVTRSYHVQALYGENEYWLCCKNVYNGLIVSYCDASWKFLRVKKIPSSVIPIDNPALTNLANGMNPISPMASPIMAVAAMISQSAPGGHSYFDYSMIKRFNEGCIHRTTVPAVSRVSSSNKTSYASSVKSRGFNGVGSYRLEQIAHEEREGDPSFATAVNSRLDYIDSWVRKDNWHNSIKLAGHSPMADPTWHFISFAIQWRVSSIYIDTPIGSMLYGAPRLQAGVWYMYQLAIQGSTARNDLPFRSHFVAKTRQTGSHALQIYIVQRQSLTAWNEKVDSKQFVRQCLRYGPYDCFSAMYKFEPGAEPPCPDIKTLIPADATFSGVFKPGGKDTGSWDGCGLSDLDDSPPASGAVGAIDSFTWKEDEKVRFVRKGSDVVDFLTLSDSEKAELVADRFFITSETDLASRGAFVLSRNEIEIMASFDSFAALKQTNDTRDASKAVRSKELELAIKGLIKEYYDKVADKVDGAAANKSFSMFYFDAKII